MSGRAHAPVDPVPGDDRFGHGPRAGITIREHYALQIHIALLRTYPGEGTREEIAAESVLQADALLAALEAPRKK